jgi:hypothetical protein
MTYGGELFMRDDPQVLSRRLAAFVRPIPAKVLAEKIGCTERTAENIRRGHWPIARHWLALVRTFGRDLTESFFTPTRPPPVSPRRLPHLKRELAAKRAALGVVAPGGRSSGPRAGGSFGSP